MKALLAHGLANKGLHPTHAVGRPLRGLPQARAAEAQAVGRTGTRGHPPSPGRAEFIRASDRRWCSTD